MDHSQQVKGSLLENTVSFLREKSGDAAVTALEKKLGPQLFDQFQMYPLEQYQTLQEEVVNMTSPTDITQGYKDLGVYAFTTFAHSIVGATLTNVSTTPKKLLEQIQTLWNTVVNFGERRLVECDETAKTAVVEIKDDPRNPAFLQGVIEAGLSSIGLTAATIEESADNNTYKIKISW